VQAQAKMKLRPTMRKASQPREDAAARAMKTIERSAPRKKYAENQSKMAPKSLFLSAPVSPPSVIDFDPDVVFRGHTEISSMKSSRQKRRNWKLHSEQFGQASQIVSSVRDGHSSRNIYGCIDGKYNYRATPLFFVEREIHLEASWSFYGSAT
jgi:hypothetical protein